MPLLEDVCRWTGATRCTQQTRLQSLWGGYGEALRLKLEGCEHRSVVVKEVRPKAGHGRSHARKLRSYAVEQAFYRRHAHRSTARVAHALHIEHTAGSWVFVFEDLTNAGFRHQGARGSAPAGRQAMHWLADFHAGFLGTMPDGLWPVGTYWHLDTRPDEWAALPEGPLKEAAAAIDARLSAARFQTLVHGDAKPANFCFGDSSAAAVDFQYTGGGCGMKDVAYFLWGHDEHRTAHLLDVYFNRLRPQVPDGVEQEWRALFPWAVADFQRFLDGWSPGRAAPTCARQLTEQVLAELR